MAQGLSYLAVRQPLIHGKTKTAPKPSLGAVLFVVIPATRTRKGEIELATFPLG